MLLFDYQHPRAFSAPRTPHRKERCTSCGCWKDKKRSCAFCASRPNRAQATQAVERIAARHDRGLEHFRSLEEMQALTSARASARSLSRSLSRGSFDRAGLDRHVSASYLSSTAQECDALPHDPRTVGTWRDNTTASTARSFLAPHSPGAGLGPEAGARAASGRPPRQQLSAATSPVGAWLSHNAADGDDQAILGGAPPAMVNDQNVAALLTRAADTITGERDALLQANTGSGRPGQAVDAMRRLMHECATIIQLGDGYLQAHVAGPSAQLSHRALRRD